FSAGVGLAGAAVFLIAFFYGSLSENKKGSAANNNHLPTASASYLISSFDWESAPGQADVGPDAISISNSAVVELSGVSGKGLNAGLPEKKINMKLPGATFDVDGIDVRIYYQRDENSGEFFRRGNSLRLRMSSGKLRIKYRVHDGNGGFIQVTQSNIYNIPNDDVLREYRFMYDPNTGIGEVFVDGLSVWSHTGIPGRTMYWNGAGDMWVGKNIDGEEKNKVVFDNLRIYSIPLIPMPIELMDFDAELIGPSVELNWITASEKNNDYFSIERSANGKDFDAIATVRGAGNSNSSLNYRYFDENPLKGISYYRLVQTDFDGKSESSKVVLVDNTPKEEAITDFSVFPNPARINLPLNINIRSETAKQAGIVIRDVAGRLVYKKEVMISAGINRLQISTDPVVENGVYMVSVIDKHDAKTSKVMFIY
ncbi:MAG: T9SS type A sorting domain-containing protein, partial [Flavobacteriales bacterium]